jgi:hypothetical protein
VLLSDPKVQKVLNRDFVTAWESVGAVPKVTIDFGNGKKMQRTLGGNTLMSVVLPDGRVIDSLPGIYTPEDFLANLQAIKGVLKMSGGVAQAEANPKDICNWHKGSASQGLGFAMTTSKTAVETPLLARLLADNPVGAPVVNTNNINLPTRTGLITLPPTSPQVLMGSGPEPPNYAFSFEKASMRLVDKSKIPAENLPPISTSTPEAEGMQVIKEDSRINQQLTRPVVHLYFASLDDKLPDVATCRDTIYDKILHTPLNDPYLGLKNVLLPGTK